MKRFAFRFLTALISMSVILFEAAFAFSDVDLESDAGKAIMKMYGHGYIQGDGDGRFRPNDTLTRAEFVTIINKMYDFTVDSENIFSDVSKDDWFYSDILIGVQSGYIKGMGDGTFRPNNKLTREEVCVMLDRILKTELLPFNHKPTDAVSEWARESVEKLISNRLFTLEDNGKFRAMEPITRSEVCVALEKCIIDTEIEIEPIDLESIAREELENKLKNMITVMKNTVIPGCTKEKSLEVAKRVTISMENYLKDPNYDYVSDAKATYKIYNTSDKKTAEELRGLILKNISTEDIGILYKFFYTPEIVTGE